MLAIETIHHVSLPVSDVDKAWDFYSDVLGLQAIPRPDFDFEGAWYEVGDRQLHLIKDDGSTFRAGKVSTRMTSILPFGSRAIAKL